MPTVDTAQGIYSVLSGIVYNIFPDTEKALVSGRVLSYSGTPAANVTVFVRDLVTGQIMRTLKTNDNGMYAFSGGSSEDWMAAAGIFASDGVEASDEIYISADISSGFWPGNVWGADLSLTKSARYWVTLSANGGIENYAGIWAYVGSYVGYVWYDPPSRSGYEFMGYFDTAEDEGGTQYYDASLIPLGVWHDVLTTVLYARWKAIAVQVEDVFVPYSWLDRFGLIGGYENSAMQDQDGDGQLTWQEYVAGSIPTNHDSVFRSILTISNGLPRLTWSPDLGATRVYSVSGKTNLNDAVWEPTNAASRFFRVRVDMP